MKRLHSGRGDQEENKSTAYHDLDRDDLDCSGGRIWPRIAQTPVIQNHQYRKLFFFNINIWLNEQFLNKIFNPVRRQKKWWKIKGIKMAYHGFFIWLYIKVEGNKTALKNMLKSHVSCIPENEIKSADRMKMEREKSWFISGRVYLFGLGFFESYLF